MENTCGCCAGLGSEYPGVGEGAVPLYHDRRARATSTAANGNSTHEIAGQFVDADGNTHGFVLSKGVFTTIDVPDAGLTSVNGISANGRLAGTYEDADEAPCLFLEQGRLHHARPARLERIARRLPQRAGRGRGRLQGRQRQTSRLHLEQGHLHHY